MDVSSPPRYRRLSSRPGPVPQSSPELPPYSRRNTLQAPPRCEQLQVEHEYHLFNGKNKPWATLKVISSAKSSDRLPTFFEREDIVGSVQLNLDRGDSIQAVAVSVTGRVITGSVSSDSFTFLDINCPLWSKASSSPSPNGSSKLQGTYLWPFSIPLPKAVSLPVPGQITQGFRLPQTFQERHTTASIQYDITVYISRGKLRADSQLRTAFGYVPSSKPEPPSILRQIAYQEECALPGPEADPEGWKALRSIIVQGSVYKSRAIEARCTLFLSKPLSYTRGSVIPCFLHIEARDAQALDMLSAPSSIVVSLRRRVRWFVGSKGVWRESFEDVGPAVWWSSGEGQSLGPYTRQLEGEIRLAKDLKPSSSIPHFSISYSVVLSPFDTVAFTPQDSQPLLAETVEVVTAYCRGPRPRAYAPPGYDPISRKSADFSVKNPFGLLTR